MPKGSSKSSPAPETNRATEDEAEIVRHLTERLRALGAEPPLAVAVSGGGDSMALVHLVREAAANLDIPASDIHTVTVDHRLRPESAEEAETVGGWMRALGLAHETLVWPGRAGGPGLQAAARRARYSLLLHWCVRRGVRTLLTAHTADDQAETVLMRLARGSGVDGLSGIGPLRLLEAEDGTRVRLLRPLLDVPRARLRAFLDARGASWFEDPSNESPVFDRVRARHALRLLEPLGLNRERVVKTAAGMARARAALDAAALAAEREAVEQDPAGFAVLDPRALAVVPREIALRVLARALMAVSGAAYRPRLERLEHAFDALAQGKARTLGGCRLVPRRDELVLICRELRGAQGRVPLASGGVAVWDGRFRVRLAAGAEGGEVGPLGAEGLAALRERPGFALTNVPSPARAVVPAFFRAGAPVAAPHLGEGLAGLEIERLAPADGLLLRFPAPGRLTAVQEGWFRGRGTLS